MRQSGSVHGVMLEIDGDGLLITGPAGIGKSDLGLSLVCLGHRLVADDVVELHRHGDELIAVRDPRYAGFVVLRDLGVVNLIKTYGAAASVARQRLDLILELERAGERTGADTGDLAGRRDSERILGVEIPKVKLALVPERPLARLAETALRDERLRRRGYRADLDFEARQRQRLWSDATWS